MNLDTTSTPRTDEACEAMGLKAFVVPLETSRQIERELTEKTNEVERLQQQIRNLQEIIDDDTKQKTELHNEVARLRELLNRAIEAAEEAIRLADIDYENDKFGKVTWLKQEISEVISEARLAPHTGEVLK